MFIRNVSVLRDKSRVIRTAYLICMAVIFMWLPLTFIAKLQAQVKDAESTNPTPIKGPITAEDYIIGPYDLVNIYILDVPELSRDYRVSAGGKITVSVLANPLDAAGLTLAQ